MFTFFRSITIVNIREWLQSRHARDLLLVFSIQVFSLIASLLISLTITNLLGAAAYGIFSYGFSWVNLLAVFSCMGYEQLALKELPAYRVENKLGLIRGYFRYATKRILIISISLSGVLFLFSYLLEHPEDNLLRKGLWLALPALPIIAMINLRFAWLRSFQFNTLSQFPDKVLRPLLLLLMLWVGYFLYGASMNVWFVITMSVASIVVALFTGNSFVKRKVISVVSGAEPAYDIVAWNKTALSLLMVNGIYFYLTQVQILILGSFRGCLLYTSDAADE